MVMKLATLRLSGLNGDLEENIQLFQGKLQFQKVEACSTVQLSGEMNKGRHHFIA